MKTLKKLLALTVCAMLLLSLIFSVTFISHEACHDCVGEECQICAVISGFSKALERLLSVTSLAPLFLVPLLFVCPLPESAFALLGEHSPVKLKVKLSN